ncbi:rhodanese-like domain-containing protein [Mucilaginibacter antarcticus]|uniref:Rhodanese-like domain-containing protein n=1 Tax=Mucilaginibacter antarcticus TaxID=1855725 RepID=A0ABW5XPV7_9SPHI
MQQISALSLKVRLQAGEQLNLLDVREELEFHTCNIGGQNLTLSKLTEEMDDINANKNDELIVICKAGMRSTTAQALLIAKGYTNVKNLTGGLLALQRLPV